jgi:acyl-CoA thioesterase YciA
MYTNPNGDIFGGWLLSQMDLGASILAKKYSQSRTATVALDKMVFRRPVWVGDVVSCYASLEKIGNTSLTIKTEAWVKRLQSGQEEKVTEGLFTFVAIDKHGRPQYVDPMKRQQ